MTHLISFPFSKCVASVFLSWQGWQLWCLHLRIYSTTCFSKVIVWRWHWSVFCEASTSDVSRSSQKLTASIEKKQKVANRYTVMDVSLTASHKVRVHKIQNFHGSPQCHARNPYVIRNFSVVPIANSRTYFIHSAWIWFVYITKYVPDFSYSYAFCLKSFAKMISWVWFWLNFGSRMSYVSCNFWMNCDNRKYT